jgi:hypothetical protein
MTWLSETPPIVNNVRFSGGLVLEGHAPLPTMVNIENSNALVVKLWWRATAAIEQEYAVFVHLVDEHGSIIAQADGVPMSGRYPTSAWAPGERIVDTRTLLLPKELGEGSYQLAVGLYNPMDGQRLSVEGSGAESFRLGILRVKPL